MTLIPAGDSLGIAIVVVSALGGGLATLAVILRVWSRRIQRVSLGWSDYTCLLALFFELILIGSTVVTVVYGLGQNIQDVDPVVIPQWLKFMFLGQILWISSNTCVRISIIFLYVSIFRVRSFRIAAYTVLGLNLAYFLAVILQTLLICQPVAFNWDHTMTGSCGDQKTSDEVIGVLNIFYDVVLIILPMPMLWKLQMAISRKLALSAIFGMGIIICIITILRVCFIVSIDDENPTHSYAVVGILANLEPLLGIINACLPVIRPVLQKFAKSRLFTRTGGSNKNTWPTAKKGSGAGNVVQGDSFRRLYDTPYPLESLANSTMQSQATGFYEVLPEGGKGVSMTDENHHGGYEIYVKNEWNVRTSEPIV